MELYADAAARLPDRLLPASGPAGRLDELSRAARAFEATFLAEMLKAAGLGKTPDEFGGGGGEDQFSSFLVDEQARHMAETGGIGLAQSIFDALKARYHD